MKAVFFQRAFWFLELLVVVAVFVAILRSSQSGVAAVTDTVWRTVAPSQQQIHRIFPERFGAPFEGHVERIKILEQKQHQGVLFPDLGSPYTGEPIDAPRMTRRWPQLRSVGLSPAILSSHVLYQRIVEGVFPILATESFDGEYRLALESELPTIGQGCEKLDSSVGGVVLVYCH